MLGALCAPCLSRDVGHDEGLKTSAANWRVPSVLIGGLYIVVTTQLLFPVSYVSALQALVLIIYTLTAFVPFIVFIFPRLKSPRKSVLLGVAVIEIVVPGLFLWSIVTD